MSLFRVLLLTTAFSMATAQAAPPPPTLASKPITGLFTGITLDTAATYALSSTEYKDFAKCQNAAPADKSTKCPAALSPGRFYIFSPAPTNIDNTYDFLNRCIEVRAGLRFDHGPIAFTGGNLTCNVEANQIVEAQILACYMRQNGAFCGLATVCFEGAEKLGMCTKDYTSQEVFVPRNSGP